MSDFRAFQDAFGEAMEGDLGHDVPLPVRRAIAIHRNTSMKSLHDALAANYPVVESLSGSDAFAGCVQAYLTAAPPQDPRLCLYGATFAQFLEDYEPFKIMPYVGSVAGLERLVTESLFAAEATTLDGREFSKDLDPDRIIRLHPATRLMTFDWPAASIWIAHQAPPSTEDWNISWQPETALVTRRVGHVHVSILTESMSALIRACTTGRSFSEIASSSVIAKGDLTIDFAQLIALGALA